MSPRTLVFFVDGGTWDVLKPAIEAGRLPHLARLVKNGASATLESVIPTETSYATAAFALGKDPAELGLFQDMSGRIPVTSDHFSGRRLWEMLSDAGARSLVVDFPCTWPTRPFDGVIFHGFFTPETGTDFVHPTRLAELYPNYPRGGVEIRDYLKLDKDVFWEKVCAVTAERVRVFRECVSREHFDFGLMYIKATDIIQHYFWNQPERVLAFWEFVDGLLGDILSDGWTHVVVASDHGFDVAPKESFSVNRWLADRGHVTLHPLRGGGFESRVRAFLAKRRWMAIPFYKVRNFLLPTAVAVATEMVDDTDHPVSSLMSTQIHIERSRAYAPGGVMHGKGIVLNDALVPRGSPEREMLREEIIRELKDLQFRGAPALVFVSRGEDVYPNSPSIPDIVFLPVPELFVEDRLQATVFGPRDTKSRATGHHLSSRDGIVVMHGPGVIPGWHDSVSILDMLPTLLAHYRLPVPAEYHGKVRTDFLSGLEPIINRSPDDAEARTALNSIDL